MQGDTLTIALFFFGSGITFLIAAINQAEWKHKALILGLFGVGVLFCLAGIFWWLIDDISPWFTAISERVASNPASWFCVIVLSVCANLLLQRRLHTPEQSAIVVGEPSAIPISAVEEIEKRVLDLDARLNALFDARDVEREKIKQDLRNAEDARLAQIDRIGERADGVSDVLKEIRLDVINLLTFAVDQATLAWLDDFVSKAPKIIDDFPPDLSSGVVERYETMQAYLRHVGSWMQHTHRSSDLQSLMVSAEYDAEGKIRAVPQHERPAEVDALDFRKYAIANLQCARVATYLRAQQQEVNERLRNQRSGLIELLQKSISS